MEDVNNEADPEPVSVRVPMLETAAGETESEAGFTDTAEPAAAERTQLPKKHIHTL